MKIKKKEDQSVSALVLLRKGNKILTGANMGAKCRAETYRKLIQRLPHLGINPRYCHQTPNTILDTKKGFLKGA